MDKNFSYWLFSAIYPISTTSLCSKKITRQIDTEITPRILNFPEEKCYSYEDSVFFRVIIQAQKKLLFESIGCAYYQLRTEKNETEKLTKNFCLCVYDHVLWILAYKQRQ